MDLKEFKINKLGRKGSVKLLRGHQPFESNVRPVTHLMNIMPARGNKEAHYFTERLEVISLFIPARQARKCPDRREVFFMIKLCFIRRSTRVQKPEIFPAALLPETENFLRSRGFSRV